MHLHEIMLHSSRRCLLSRCRACAGLRFILGRPVSFKTLNLNKDGAREQETGSQRSLTSIDQLQKRHGEKNATLHLRWVWLVNRKDGKLKAGLLFHFYRDILLLFLLPFSRPPPSEKHAGEVCQPQTNTKLYLHTKHGINTCPEPLLTRGLNQFSSGLRCYQSEQPYQITTLLISSAAGKPRAFW